VSTFWNCTRKPPKREQVACYLAVAREVGSRLVLNSIYSFSCRYSMSYDISISLLKKNFCKETLVKALGKGELIFKRRAGDQSNMTTILVNSGQSHITTSIPSVVPCKYSEPYLCHGSTLRVLHPAPFSIFPKSTFEKQNRHWARQQSSQPSMTEDSAIRIDLHSAEVVHFTHNIR
jgi:hypothetical protein